MEASAIEPAISLLDVCRCFMQGMCAPPGTKTLFNLSGAKTERVSAVGNNFSAAASACALKPEVAKDALRQQANLSRSVYPFKQGAQSL